MSSLLRVSRLTNLEAAPMLYGAVQFDTTSLTMQSSLYAQVHQIHLCPITLATNFLRSIGRANRQTVRHLSLLMKVLLPKQKHTKHVPQRSPYPKSFIKWDDVVLKIDVLGILLRHLRLDFSDLEIVCTNWQHEEFPGAYSMCVNSCMRMLPTVKVESLELLGDFKLQEAERLGRSMGAEKVGLINRLFSIRSHDKSWVLESLWAMKS